MANFKIQKIIDEQGNVCFFNVYEKRIRKNKFFQILLGDNIKFHGSFSNYKLAEQYLKKYCLGDSK